MRGKKYEEDPCRARVRSNLGDSGWVRLVRSDVAGAFGQPEHLPPLPTRTTHTYGLGMRVAVQPGLTMGSSIG